MVNMEESLLKTLLGGVAIEIPPLSDLNNYTDIGTYRANGNTIAAGLSNCPTAKAFAMKVEAGWSRTLTTQTILDYSNNMYTRTRSAASWTPWKMISGETV
jgi:hypothetical protein